MKTKQSRITVATECHAARNGFRNDKMGSQAVMLTLFLCLLWGGLSPAIKLSLDGMPPLGIAAWRFLVGLACLLLWCLARRIPWWLPAGFHRSLIALSLLFALQIALLNVGTRLTSSNHAIVFLSTNPLFVAFLSHFLIPNDRLSLVKLGGLSLSFVGIYVIFLEGGEAPSRSQLHGDLIVLTSGFLLGLVQVYCKFLIRTLNPFQIVIWEMIYGVPLFFMGSLWLEGNSVYRLTTAVVASILYQGIVVAAFCFATWTHLLERFSASRLSAFQFTTPIFGVILSWLLLGDSTSSTFVAGVALVAAGIYLVSSTPIQSQ